MTSGRLPTVDAIVPCYQYGRYLESCVASILGQQGVQVRILIIDDMSSDDTEVIGRRLQEQHPQVEYRRHIRNLGSIETFNEGLDWAASEFMLLISADDYVLPGAFARATDLMRGHPEVGFTIGKTVDLLGPESTEYSDTLPNKLIERNAAGKASFVAGEVQFLKMLVRADALNIVRTPTAIVRTSAQKIVGKYRADQIHTSDLDMWLRFSLSYRMGVINDMQAAYRLHGANLQNTFYTRGGLADLEQRRHVYLDHFRNSKLRDATMAGLEQDIRKLLCREASQRAFGFLHTENHELAANLARFAFETYPRFKWQPAGIRMRLKSQLSHRAWRSLRRIFGRQDLG
jgi:glycosyltransferase involved in cell wall biosynthesis